MFGYVVHIMLDVLMFAVNLEVFYKEKRTYNLLFCVLFCIELFRVYCLLICLPSNVNISIEFVEAAILIATIALFFKDKYKIE